MRLKLVGLAAAALLATPAAAPASSIEHTVRTVTFEASYTVEGVVPRSERVERWVAFDRAHQVIKTSSTGLLRVRGGAGAAEVHGVRRRAQRGLDAPGRRGRHAARHVRALARRRGRRHQDPVAKGWLVKTGDTTFLGRPAIKLESAPNAPGEGNSKLTVVADATTYAPYERVVTGRERGETFKQREVVESSRRCRWPTTSTSSYMGPGSARAKRVTFAESGKAALEAAKKKQSSKSKAAKKKRKAKQQSRR